MACGKTTAYEVRWRPAGSGAGWRSRRFAAGDGPAITLTGLDRTITYEIEARAIGPDGQASAWVPVMATVGGVSQLPSPPTVVTTTPSPDGVTVEWDIPADNRPDTVYVVERAPSATGPWTEKGRTRGGKLYLPVEDDTAWHWRVRSETWEGTLGGYSAVVVQARGRVPRTAGDIAYSDGTPIESLKPAEPGATQGAVIDDGTGTGNVRLPDGTPVNNMMLLVKDITVAQLPAQGTHDGQLLILDDPADGIPPVWYQWDAQSNQWVKRAPASLPELDPVRGSKLDGVEDGATRSRVIVQASAPASPTLNDLWYDTTAKRLKRWEGSAWVEVGSLNTGALADRDDVDIAAGHLKDNGITLPADRVRNDMLLLDQSGSLVINASGGPINLGSVTLTGIGGKSLAFKDKIDQISDLTANVVVGDALRKTTKVEIGSTNPIHISGNDAVWSGYRLWVGADTPQDAPFCVDQNGKAKLVAPEIYDAAGNLVFDGTKFTGLAQTQATEPAPVGINPYVVSCADDNDIKQVELTVQSSVTAKATISLKNRTSTPAGSYPATVTLTIQRRPVGQSTWTTVGTATFTKTATTPASGQYQVASIDMTDPEPRLGGGTITISYDMVVAENGLEVSATETVPAGMWEYRVTCSRPVGRQLTLTDNTGGGFVVSGASAQQGTGGTYLPVTGGTITGDLAVSGDLTVSGDLVTVSSQQVDIGDNIVRLNAGLPDTSTPTLDAGIEIERGNQVNVKIYWDEANDRWCLSTPAGAYKIWHDGNVPATATRWPTWSEVTGKPTAFTPSAHTHSASDIADGPGSGLDADKLDGLESAQFLRTDVSTNVITAVSPSIHFYDIEAGYERRTYIGRWRSTFGIEERATDGTYVRAPFVIEDGPTTQLRGKSDGTWTINGNVVWHAGNDGAGSGLDADKLDGVQLSDLATTVNADIRKVAFGGAYVHGSLADFNADVGHGWSYVNGLTNAPPHGATQGGYRLRVALGSNYSVDGGTGSYALELATARHTGAPGYAYLYKRTKESGSWTSWVKISAGYADDADKLDGLDSSQFLRSDANDTYTGGVLTIRQGSGGYLTFTATNSTRTGWINWHYPNGDRACYIGYADQTSKIVNWWFENGSSLKIDGGAGSGYVGIAYTPTSSYRLAVGGAILATGEIRSSLPGTGAHIRLLNSTGYGYLIGSATSGRLYIAPSDAAGTWLWSREFGYDPTTGHWYAENGFDITSGDLTVDGSIELKNVSGRGIRFWQSDAYKIYMSSAADPTWGGRAPGETTSDYNMYFRMSYGVNRGWVFRNDTTNVAGIDGGGNIYAQGTITGQEITATSDKRLKGNIRPIKDALAIVSQLRGVRFRWRGLKGNPQGPDRIGLIAQEVQPHLPEVVHERGDGTLTIDYGALIGLLVEAIKEQNAKLDAIEARLAALEGTA